MTVPDIILLLCFIPSIVSGVSKGFVKQLVDLASLVGGAWAAFHYSGTVSLWLKERFTTTDEKLLYILSFAIIVVAVVLALNIVGHLICRVIKIASLSGLNRIAGLVLGIFNTALLLGIAIMIFKGINARWGLVNPEVLKNSVIYNTLGDFAEFIFPRLENLVTGGTAANV